MIDKLNQIKFQIENVKEKDWDSGQASHSGGRLLDHHFYMMMLMMITIMTMMMMMMMVVQRKMWLVWKSN